MILSIIYLLLWIIFVIQLLLLLLFLSNWLLYCNLWLTNEIIFIKKKIFDPYSNSKNIAELQFVTSF